MMTRIVVVIVVVAAEPSSCASMLEWPVLNSTPDAVMSLVCVCVTTEVVVRGAVGWYSMKIQQAVQVGSASRVTLETVQRR